jgi:hypothetical protein
MLIGCNQWVTSEIFTRYILIVNIFVKLVIQSLVLGQITLKVIMIPPNKHISLL